MTKEGKDIVCFICCVAAFAVGSGEPWMSVSLGFGLLFLKSYEPYQR